MITPALITVSLVNAVLLGWLGLTVLLNAERRAVGVWFTGGALLLGGFFFLLQSMVASQGLSQITVAMHLQWPLGWMIGLVLSLAWYASMLWHAGFFDREQVSLRRRHGPWVLVALALAGCVAVLVILAAAYPFSLGRAPLEPFARPAVGRVPLLALAYPAAIVLCIALSLDVLRHPAPSPRLMGDLARRRARPWLMAGSIGLLLVSCLVGAIMVGVALRNPRELADIIPGHIPDVVVWGDLAVSCLITVSVLFLGQAMVAYEIFTGKTLPRGGLRRHWYSAIVLALGCGLLTGWTVATDSTPFYGLLLAAVLVTVFYALFGWRSYVERDRYIEHLRPFVTAPRVYDALLQPQAPEVDAAGPFRTLCSEVLDARVAYLIPVGPLSSIAGPPLAHPEHASAPTDISEIAGGCASPEATCLPVDPTEYAGAVWAVPLWSERGLIGLLLMGEKTDGGLYTQEEMEVARASAERLIDTLACARMAQRLMALQRRRLAEGQVVDARARRLIHDDVLPGLHAAMLALRPPDGGSTSSVVEGLADVHARLSDLLREMPTAGAADVAEMGLTACLQRAVEKEFDEAFDDVTWELAPESETQVRQLPPLTAEVLFYAAREAIRNAARHGAAGDADRALHLRVVMLWRDGLELVVQDDGVGMGASAQAGGTGHGIALHSTMMAVIGGGWVTESVPGKFTRVTISLPEASWADPTDEDGPQPADR